MTNTEKEILACEEKIKQADASSEPDTSYILNDLLADDIILIGPQGQIITKSFVLDAHRPPKKQPFDKVTVRELVIKDLGETVVVNCRTEFVQKAESFSLRFMRVWHKEHGKWKLISGTVTSIV